MLLESTVQNLRWTEVGMRRITEKKGEEELDSVSSWEWGRRGKSEKIESRERRKRGRRWGVERRRREKWSRGVRMEKGRSERLRKRWRERWGGQSI